MICFPCCHYQMLNLEGAGQGESFFLSFVSKSALSLLFSLIRPQQYENTARGMRVNWGHTCQGNDVWPTMLVKFGQISKVQIKHQSAVVHTVSDLGQTPQQPNGWGLKTKHEGQWGLKLTKVYLIYLRVYRFFKHKRLYQLTIYVSCLQTILCVYEIIGCWGDQTGAAQYKQEGLTMH